MPPSSLSVPRDLEVPDGTVLRLPVEWTDRGAPVIPPRVEGREVRLSARGLSEARVTKPARAARRQAATRARSDGGDDDAKRGVAEHHGSRGAERLIRRAARATKPARAARRRAARGARSDGDDDDAKRGVAEHHGSRGAAERLIRRGLTQGRGALSGGVKFVVVPRLARVTRVTTPPGTRYQTGGVALASRTGEAMDLLGVRPYRPGDPVRHLHARSWARVGEPVVREYQEEYFSRIGVVVETAVADARRLEAILSLAAGIVAHLSRGEALIDLLVVGDRVHELTIGRHLGFLDQALDLLACVEAEKKGPDPEALAARLRPHLGRLSCVIVVAAAWDGGVLGDRIRGGGAGCVTVIVEAGEGGKAGVGERERAPRDAGVHVVSVGAIEKGEALAF